MYAVPAPFELVLKFPWAISKFKPAYGRAPPPLIPSINMCPSGDVNSSCNEPLYDSFTTLTVWISHMSNTQTPSRGFQPSHVFCVYTCSNIHCKHSLLQYFFRFPVFKADMDAVFRVRLFWINSCTVFFLTMCLKYSLRARHLYFFKGMLF